VTRRCNPRTQRKPHANNVTKISVIKWHLLPNPSRVRQRLAYVVLFCRPNEALTVTTQCDVHKKAKTTTLTSDLRHNCESGYDCAFRLICVMLIMRLRFVRVRRDFKNCLLTYVVKHLRQVTLWRQTKQSNSKNHKRRNLLSINVTP